MDTITFDQALELLTLPEDMVIFCAQPARLSQTQAELTSDITRDEYILVGVHADIGFNIRREYNETVKIQGNRMTINLTGGDKPSPLDIIFVYFYFSKPLKTVAKIVAKMKD